MRTMLAGAILLLWGTPTIAQSFDYGVANAQSMQQTIIQGATNSNIIRGMYDGGRHVGTSGIHVGRPGPHASRDHQAPGRPARGGVAGVVPRSAAMFATPAPQGGPPAAMPYRSTPALRREAADSVVARTSQQNPEAGRALRDQLAQHDYSRIYAGIVRPFGYRVDDTADAVAAYTLLGWLIATGAQDPSPGDAQAVRAQVARSLASNAAFDDPHTRAALAEEMKVMFVTLHAGWQSARKEGSLRAYADGVARIFAQQTGSDLRSMRLTPRGFQQGRG